jgi:hypothetical protein
MGDKFWRLGEEKIKPNADMINWYLVGIEPGSSCCIVGASTYALVAEAIKRNIDVTVIDFSKKMCADLESALAGAKCKVIVHDILETTPSSIRNSFSYLLSDRLINRFSIDETIEFFHNAPTLLSPSGELRTVIRMGLYELDKKLIAYQEKHNLSEKIYDEEKNIIDFTNSKQALEEISPEMGAIPRDILIDWYVKRGRESRYTESLIDNVLMKNGQLKLLNKQPTTDKTPSIYYQLKVHSG